MWSDHPSVDGAEIYARLDNVNDIEYLKRIAPLMDAAELILQVHAPNLDELNQYNILLLYNSIAKLYNKRLLLVAHPVPSESISTSIKESIEHLKLIHHRIKKYDFNLDVSLENLNPLNEVNRPGVPAIDEVLSHDESTFFCWDVGHAVHAGDSSELSISLKFRLGNVHIHDLNETKDHYPFKYGSVDIKQTAKYLFQLQYEKSIVHELALDFLGGNSDIERHIEYLKEIKRIRDIMEYVIYQEILSSTRSN